MEAACLGFGICQGFVLRWLLITGSHGRLADETERILDLFFHGVMGALAEGACEKRPALRRPARAPDSASPFLMEARS